MGAQIESGVINTLSYNDLLNRMKMLEDKVEGLEKKSAKAEEKAEMYRRQIGGTNAAQRRVKQRADELEQLVISYDEALMEFCIWIDVDGDKLIEEKDLELVEPLRKRAEKLKVALSTSIPERVERHGRTL